MTTKKTTTAPHGANDVTAASAQAALPAAAASLAPPGAPLTAASPLTDRVARALGYLALATEALALEAPPLSALDRMRLGKLRRGGEAHMPLIGQLADEWGVSVRTQPTDGMMDNAGTVAALRPLAGAIHAFAQEVQDTSAVASSHAWSTATALYSVLKRMSKKDPKLAVQLAPVTEFFAFRRPPVTEVKPGKRERRKAKKLAEARALVDAAHAKEAPQEAEAPAKDVNGSGAAPAGQ